MLSSRLSFRLAIAALMFLGGSSVSAMQSESGQTARIYVKQPATEGTYLQITGTIQEITDAYIVVDQEGKRILYERSAVHHVELTPDPTGAIDGPGIGETVKRHWSWRREGQLPVVLRQLPLIGDYFHGAAVPHLPGDLDIMLAMALLSLFAAFGIYKVYETVVLNRIKVQLEIRQLQGQLAQDPTAPRLEGMIGFLKHRILGILPEAQRQERENRWRNRWRAYRQTAEWLPVTVYILARVVTLVSALFVLFMAIGLVGVAASDSEKAAIGTRLTALGMAVLSVAGSARLFRTFWILRRSFRPAEAATGLSGAIVFAAGLVAVVLFNVRFALTPIVTIDLTVVSPLLVVLLAYRFGGLKAAVAGFLAASLSLPLRIATWRGEWQSLIYRDFGLGPLAFAHSSFDDLVRLVLLGSLAGWLFAWVRRVTHQTEWLAGTGSAPHESPVSRSRAGLLLAFALGTALIILSNVVYRLPDRSFVPFAGLSLIVCGGTGFLLGSRRGWVAGAAAIIVSIIIQLCVLGPMSKVRMDLAEAGHALSFALLGYWAGRIGQTLGSRVAVRHAAARLHLSQQSRNPVTTSAVLFVPALLLFSVIWKVNSSGRSTDLEVLVPPLTMATVMLMGATCGARSAAWTVGLTLGAWTLLGHSAVYWGWLPTFQIELFTLSLHPRWSAPGILILTTTAWLAGHIGLVGNRRNRYWLAVAIFVALELSNILRYGIFLLPYVKGVVAGIRIDLLTGVARLAEPWLTVLLFGLGLEGFRRSGRVRA
jgi:hypothetical protein